MVKTRVKLFETSYKREKKNSYDVFFHIKRIIIRKKKRTTEWKRKKKVKKHGNEEPFVFFFSRSTMTRINPFPPTLSRTDAMPFFFFTNTGNYMWQILISVIAARRIFCGPKKAI